MQTDIFAEVDKQAKSVPVRASWRGVLSLNVPSLGLGSVQYHLRAAKAHGDQKPVSFFKVDKATDQQVVARDVPKLFSYKLGPSGERLDVTEIPYEEVKDKVKFDDSYLVFAKNEKRFFLKDQLEVSGVWTEIPVNQIVDKQDGEDIAPFERTTDIEVDEEGYVPMERIAEYKFKEVYQLSPDIDKKVRESTTRVTKLARHLLEKQSALVAFFSWGRGYQYYTAVIFPYERRDGTLWLLMGMSEGILQLDVTWSLETDQEAAPVAPMPLATVKRKPQVSISK